MIKNFPVLKLLSGLVRKPLSYINKMLELMSSDKNYMNINSVIFFMYILFLCFSIPSNNKCRICYNDIFYNDIFFQ